MNNENFWNKLPKPFFVLAPMEAVTDVVFRETVWHAGELVKNSNDLRELAGSTPDVTMTEFVNTKSFCSDAGEFSTRGRLVFAPNEIKNGRKLVAQIWGKEPENFREMSKAMFARGFSGVDINMGCPDKAVVRTGSGSGLIENPENAAKILRETQNGFYDFIRENEEVFSGLSDDEIREKISLDKVPVSVKTRLGARKVDEWRDWLTVLLREKPANLTVHLRTRKEMSKVAAHFELIPEIANLRDEISPETRLTINGDVISRKMGVELSQKYPQVDGWMIGRGIFNNPFAFTDLEDPTREQLFELLRYQLAKYDEFREIISAEDSPNGNEISRKFDPLKHFFKIYTNGFYGAKKLREEMMAALTTDEVREIMNEFEKSLEK